MIQQREDFRVFFTIVGFERSVLKSHFGLRSALAENVHVRDFVDIYLIHVPILSVSYVLSRRAEAKTLNPSCKRTV